MHRINVSQTHRGGICRGVGCRRVWVPVGIEEEVSQFPNVTISGGERLVTALALGGKAEVIFFSVCHTYEVRNMVI